MKSFLPSILILLCVWLPASGQAGTGLQTRYDGFTDQTLVATREMSLVSSGSVKVTMIASFRYAGKDQKTPESVMLLFIVLADRWLFLDAPNVLAVTQDKSGEIERFDLGIGRVVTSKVYIGRHVRTREAVSLPVALRDFLKLADSERLQLRLRTGLEFDLDGKNFQQIKALAGQLKSKGSRS